MTEVFAYLTNPVDIALFAGIIVDCLTILPLIAVTLDIPRRYNPVDDDRH